MRYASYILVGGMIFFIIGMSLLFTIEPPAGNELNCFVPLSLYQKNDITKTDTIQSIIHGDRLHIDYKLLLEVPDTLRRTATCTVHDDQSTYLLQGDSIIFQCETHYYY